MRLEVSVPLTLPSPQTKDAISCPTTYGHYEPHVLRGGIHETHALLGKCCVVKAHAGLCRCTVSPYHGNINEYDQGTTLTQQWPVITLMSTCCYLTLHNKKNHPLSINITSPVSAAYGFLPSQQPLHPVSEAAEGILE